MTFAEMFCQYPNGLPPTADPELSAALSADLTAQTQLIIDAEDRAQDRAWITTCAALDKAARESRS